MLHVDVPPQLEQHGKVADVSGSMYLTCRHVEAAVPWLSWPDVVKYFRVFAVPVNHAVDSTMYFYLLHILLANTI